MIFDSVQLRQLPEDSILKRYGNGDSRELDNCYTDCFTLTLSHAVTFDDYVRAFYTTPIFKLERVLLKIFAGYSSTDNDAAQLAAGKTDVFSAWTVEERTSNQILMSDASGRTRSWLMIRYNDDESEKGVCLLFGSAVLPIVNRTNGERKLGVFLLILLKFHKIYSKILISSARRKLKNAYGNN